MKDMIAKLYELQQKNLVLSPWGRNTPLAARTTFVRDEIEEELQELEKKNWPGFKDEIGDVLWDCLGVIARAEKEGHFTMADVLEHIHTKYKERKPFLFAGKMVTSEEQEKI